jgi:hypothetical protein
MAKPKARLQVTGSRSFQDREGITRSNVTGAANRSIGMRSKRRQKLWATNQRKSRTEPIPNQVKDKGALGEDSAPVPKERRDH